MTNQPPPRLTTPQPSTDDYQQLVESFTQAVWEANPAGQIVNDSPSWRAYTGQTTAQWLGEGWTNAVHPHQRQAVLAQWRQAVADHQPVQAEYQLQHAQGGWRWTSVRATPVFEPDGSVRKWIGLNVDISQRKGAEEALRQSEQRLALAIDIGGIGHWALNLATQELTTSAHCRANFGRSQGLPFSYEQLVASIHPEDRERQQRVVQEAIQRQAGFQVEYRIITPQQTIEWVHIQSRYEPGEPARLVGVSMNTTQHKLAEGALLAADRRKDEFLAMLAHELRNPMATLRNGLNILNLTHEGDSLPGHTIGMMNRQLDHLVRLVDDLLDVSRISQGKIELKRERLELGALVAEAVEAMCPLFTTQHKTLHLMGWTSPLIMEGDATRLSQLVSNLLTNSLRYTGVQGQVRVSLATEQGQAVVRVADNGIGLTGEQCTTIFELFVQADTSLVRSQGGLGIGLTLAQRLARLHGGRIEVHSSGLGQGSEFVVFLPLWADSTPAVQSLDPVISSKPAGHRLLVIDDNADSALTLSMLLTLKGYAVTSALSGLEGLQVAQALQPSVILCDLSMPGMDGYEVCRRLRGEAWSASMVLIALTGYGQAGDRQRTKSAGFDAHLVKPIDLGVLTQLLNELPVPG